MQKIRITILYGMIAAAAAMIFFCTFLQVNAGYITGSEGKFTHTHIEACYTEVTLSCTDKHTSKHMIDSGTYQCTTCGIMTDQLVQFDLWSCPRLGVTWEENGCINCKICGTQHSCWDIYMPGVHTYKEKRLNCGISEGTTTATFAVGADDAWTNSGTTITAKINVLKQDLIYGNISCSWTDGKLYVTENGTYSATAKDAKGRSITSSINISCIDKNTPVIKSVDADTDGMTRTSIYVNVLAEDDESGLAEQAYSFDGGQTWSASSRFLLEEGMDIQLAVRDKAGNIVKRDLKRSAFPYPPYPSPSQSPSPTPYPSPSLSPTPYPSPSTTSSSSSASSSYPSDSAGSSEAASADSANDSTALGQSFDGNAEKEASDSSAGVSGKEKGGNSRDLVKRDSSRKNGVTAEAENTETTAAENFDEDESNIDTNSLFQAEEEDILRAMEAAEGQEAVLESLKKKFLKTRAAAFPSKGSEPDGEKVKMASDKSEMFLADIAAYIRTHLQSLLGLGFIVTALLLALRLIWLHSAVLYCYNGGEEYRRVALLHVRRRKQEFELYLPEYMLETRGTPRYRLMFKEKLIKKHGGADLVVHGEDYKLRQPLEECVDFVL